jgi:hypothetical protein
MSHYQNPFAGDDDRYALWEMLVERDIEAFVNSDWASVEPDFIADSFTAIDAKFDPNPDNWGLSFYKLENYRDSWLKDSLETVAKVEKDKLRAAIIAATNMTQIEVKGDSALLHKKFNGQIVTDSGEVLPMHWQTLYQCRKINGTWKIAGFVGYMPYAGN